MAADRRAKPSAKQPKPAVRLPRSAASSKSAAASSKSSSARARLDDLAGELVDAGSREHYADAALYDFEYRRRRADVNFYRDLAKRQLAALGGRGSDGPTSAGLHVLELGAGSGRVTIPLARDGHHVVALDQSQPMLDKLRARVAALPDASRGRVEVVSGELCTFQLVDTAGKPRRFPLAIAAFNVLEHLYTRGELDACLRRVRAHLAPGGLFAFDVQLPDLEWLTRDPRKRWAKTRFTDPTTKQAVYYSTNHDYDAVSQIALIRIYYDPVEGGPGWVVKLTQRKFFPAELEALIAHAGLALAERYGDFSWGPLTNSSDSQILLCEAVEPAIPRR